jgi:L-amino acid N-acyltransferase YncA
MNGSSGFVVREAASADAEAVTRIYNQGIEDRVATFETAPRSVDALRARIAAGEQYPLVVAERGERVVAWAGLSEYRPRACYAGVAEFSVYTDRDARGQGAGRAVLSDLLRVAEARGFWKVLSRIFPENRASRALCRSLGFREVGVYERHAQLEGEWRDVVIVEKLLGEAG